MRQIETLRIESMKARLDELRNLREIIIRNANNQGCEILKYDDFEIEEEFLRLVVNIDEKQFYFGLMYYEDWFRAHCIVSSMDDKTVILMGVKPVGDFEPEL